MTSAHRHMVIGLQASGKTTFAAALWYILANGGVSTVLARGLHAGDYSYLDKIADLWERGYKVPRTEHYEHQTISINLVDPSSGKSMSLTFADLPGEGFERAFATRRLAEPIAEALQGVHGLLLFVSAAVGPDDISILDIAKGVGLEDEFVDDDDDHEDSVIPEGDRSGGNTSTETSAPKFVPFTPGETPRDVQIVDILQSLQQRPVGGSFPRIVVIVSAWDKVVRAANPAEWLFTNMPLLDQYLRNTHIPTRIYGVSAQGGDVPKDSTAPDQLERQKLLLISNASARVEVVGYGADKHDLTHAIRWLSGLEVE
ncbi:hypothetical protein [Rhizobium sp. PL01]|uniref:TRAFAC clade GTPase domain-containing protein n=1 Tax=Rhizobium sp. PL01 TaxID=3085631 RepID=UPI0029814A0E|nr:hypothetical protein [Rhizobium sp. PL01]MDW5312995.1 hypothetical protein [Rhizobium sp. PL01]